MRGADGPPGARRGALDALCGAAARADLAPRALLRPLAALAAAVLGARDDGDRALGLVDAQIWRSWAVEERDGGLAEAFALCERVAIAQTEAVPAAAESAAEDPRSGRPAPSEGGRVPPAGAEPTPSRSHALDEFWFGGEFEELAAPLFAALGDAPRDGGGHEGAGAEAWLRAAPAGALLLACVAQLSDIGLERVGAASQARAFSPPAAVAERALARRLEPPDAVTDLVAWACDGGDVPSDEAREGVFKARQRVAGALAALPELGDAVSSSVLGTRGLVQRLAAAALRARTRSGPALAARAELLGRLSARGGAAAVARALADVCLPVEGRDDRSPNEDAAAAVLAELDASDAWLRVAAAGLVALGSSRGGGPGGGGRRESPSSAPRTAWPAGPDRATAACLRFLAVAAPAQSAAHRRLLRDKLPLRGALPGPAVAAVVHALHGPPRGAAAADRAEMPSELTLAARQVALAWGDREAVRGSSESFLAHRARTYFLVSALRKLADAEPPEGACDDAANREGGSLRNDAADREGGSLLDGTSVALDADVGLIPALLTGVAAHLDSSDDPVRECGMRVGTALAALVQPDKPGPFDGLMTEADDADYWEDRRAAAEARLITAAREAAPTPPPCRARRPRRGGERRAPRPKPAVASWVDPGVDTETDSDDDSSPWAGDAPRRRTAGRRRSAPAAPSAASSGSGSGSSSELSFSESEGDSTGSSGPSSSDDSDEERALSLQLRDLPGALAGYEQDWRAALRALWASEAMLLSGVDEVAAYAPSVATALLRFRPPPWAGQEAPRGTPVDATRVRAAAIVAAVVADPLPAGLAAIDEIFSASSDVQARVDALGALASAAGELRSPGSALPLRAGRVPRTPAGDAGGGSRLLLGRAEDGGRAGLAAPAAAPARRAPQPLASRGAVFAAWASAILRRAGTPTHGLDMLGRDAYVLSRALVTMSAMLEACGGCPEAETLAAASLEFARLDAVHGSGEPAVRRATALLVASALDAVPRPRLLEALLLQDGGDDDPDDGPARAALEVAARSGAVVRVEAGVRTPRAPSAPAGAAPTPATGGEGGSPAGRGVRPDVGTGSALGQGAVPRVATVRLNELLDPDASGGSLPAALLELAAPDGSLDPGTARRGAVASPAAASTVPRWLYAPEALLASDLRWASRWLDASTKDPDPVTADSAKAAGRLRDAFTGDAIRRAVAARPRTLAEGGELLFPAVDLGSAPGRDAAELVLPRAGRSH